jgi:NADH-quinone oxidoreductase subunit N
MAQLAQINLNALLPEIAVLAAGFFLLLVSLVFKARGAGGRAGAVAAGVSVAGLAVAAYMSLCQWHSLSSGFGGLLIADPFTTFFNLTLLGGAILCVLLSVRETGGMRTLSGEYYALLVLSVFGMLVMVSAADLIVAFVGLETMSLAVYIMVGIHRERKECNEAALKYFLIGSFASAFLIYGIALLYGVAGSTRFSDLSAGLASGGGSTVALAGMGLLLVGLFFKVAAVPFHMWAPDAYEGAPTPITAFMAVAVKAAAFGLLSRLLLTGLLPLSGYWLPLFWSLAVATMTVGNLAAVFQGNVKRMLAYSSIAHAGYLMVALASLNPSTGGLSGDRALQSVLFYLVVYTLMNVGAFGVLIYLGRPDRPMETLEDLRGAGLRYPFMGAAMAIFMFSLAGIPPTGGFIAKFYVFSAAIDRGLVSLAVIGVLNSAVSVYYYLRVTVQMYMRESEQALPAAVFSLPLGLAVFLAAWGVLQLGMKPSPLIEAARQAVIFLNLR